MAKDQLRDLHLFAMESALPFGMGIINNAKTGGFQKIMDVFKSKDPFLEFQIDGEASAKRVRDKIDQLIPPHSIIASNTFIFILYSFQSNLGKRTSQGLCWR